MPRPHHSGSALAAVIAVPLLLSTVTATAVPVSTAHPGTGRPRTATAAGSTATAAGSTATAAVSTLVPRCPTAHLTAHLLSVDAGAGQRYQPVRLTNTGPGPCAIQGWGGFGLLDAHHRPLPTTVTRDDLAAGAHRVVLRPGHSVTTTVHFSVVGGASGRDYTHPAYLEITPPDAVHHLTVPFTTPVFRGDLDSTPYTAHR